MACIYLWAVFFQFGWGPCCWILVRYVESAPVKGRTVWLTAGLVRFRLLVSGL